MKRSEADAEQALLWTFVISLCALILTMLIGRFLETRHIHQLPHSGVGVLVGALGAGLLRLFAASSRTQIDNDMLKDEKFDYEFFMTALLPPIIFEAGFNVHVPTMRRNIALTSFFAFFGTAFSTAVVGLLCYAAGQVGLCYPMGLLASLVFGSLISATDPVSVLSVFKACGVEDDIFAMVFGESVLNDAVAIVLTRTLLSFNAASAEPYGARVLSAFVLFLMDFLSSLLLGAAFGYASYHVVRRLRLRASDAEDDRTLAIALVFAFPWTSYYVAEALQMSGVVTLLFCGAVMGQTTRGQLSDEAGRLASTTFKSIATVAETAVFIYLGQAIFSFPILHETVWRFFLVALAACALGRSHVFVGVCLANLCRARRHRPGAKRPLVYLPRGVPLVLWWSGLRGGVAFALASASFGYDDFVEHCGGWNPRVHRSARAELHCTDHRGMSDGLAILQTTLLVATFSIFVLGGTIKDVATCCGVLKRSTQPV